MRKGEQKENKKLTDSSYGSNIDEASFIVNSNELTFLTIERWEIAVIDITCRGRQLKIKAWCLAFSICIISERRGWSRRR
jgi:hypothetical protein